MADSHYSRQKIGSPQFMPPGSCMVLKAATDRGFALWGTSWPKEEFTKHEWSGAWMCSIFRNEGAGLSSKLIRTAVAATRAFYGDPPAQGMVTFVDASKVKAKKDPGHCFIIAGFRPVGWTKRRNFLALQMLPGKMPAPEWPIGMQASMF